MKLEVRSQLGYKHTPLGWIPSSWEVKELGEVLVLKRGFDLTSSERLTGDVPVVSSSGISGFHNVAAAKAPGVVTGRYGTVGEVFYIEKDYWPHNTTLFIDDFKGTLPRYAYYLLASINLHAYSGKSAVPGLNRNHVHSEVIAYPPQPEQQRIAAILVTWDVAIQKTLQLIEQLRQRNKGLMQQLLTGKKRLKGFSEKWNEYAFDECFTILKSYSISRDGLYYEAGEHNIYCIHYGDIHALFNGVFLDFKKETRVPQIKDGTTSVNEDDYLRDGDIIMADASEDYQGVGAAVEVVNLGDRTVVGGLHTIVLRLRNLNIAPGYLAFLFASEQVRNELRKKATGISVYSISKSSLRTLSLTLPAIKEQLAIAHTLTTADNELKLYEQQLTALREQKKGLMQQLLTGKIITV